MSEHPDTRKYEIAVCSLCGSDNIFSTEHDSWCDDCREWMSAEIEVVVPEAASARAIDLLRPIDRENLIERLIEADEALFEAGDAVSHRASAEAALRVVEDYIDQRLREVAMSHDHGGPHE